MHDVVTDRSRAIGRLRLSLVRRLWEPSPPCSGRSEKTPIHVWTKDHFEKPIVLGKLCFGPSRGCQRAGGDQKEIGSKVAQPNYRKSAMQTRVLSVALRDGLLTVEGEQWRSQRRTLAPLSSGSMVMRYAPTMAAAVDAMIWTLARVQKDGLVLDIGTGNEPPGAGRPRPHLLFRRSRRRFRSYADCDLRPISRSPAASTRSTFWAFQTSYPA